VCTAQYGEEMCVYCTVKRGNVCVLHGIERHSVRTAQYREALCVYCMCTAQSRGALCVYCTV